MALVWITKLFNFRRETFVLRQNDPTYFPVIGGQSFADGTPITVGPGSQRDASQFVIPWTGARNTAGTQTARLDVHGPHGVVSFNVGPKDANTGHDFLLGFDGHQNELVGADMGPRGPFYAVSLHLVFNEKGLLWQIVDTQGIGQGALDGAQRLLEGVAPTLLEKALA
jgi:hypothetical protein